MAKSYGLRRSGFVLQHGVWQDVDTSALAVISTPDSEERCVQVTRPIAAGECVLNVPAACTINSFDVALTPLGEILHAGGVDYNAGIIAAYILRESEDPGSKWAPYLAALPRSFSHLPNSLLHVLAPVIPGTLALNFMLVDARRMVEAFRGARDVDPGYAWDLTRFAWASMAVRTRAFHGRMHGQRVSMLVPLVDMLNHSADPDIAWTTPEDGGMILSAARDLQPGREIFISYGERSNSILFARYGFTLADNPLREALVVVRPTQPVSGSRAMLLQGSGPYALPVRADYYTEETAKLVSYLRVLNATETQAAALLESGVAAAMIAPIDGDNDRRVRANIVTLTQIARRELAVTLPRIEALPTALARTVRGIFDEENAVLEWLENNSATI